ncbi:MAG: nucleotide exchange factor GrpE [Deltaproteobacteria bacterium]|nr:nucleotide exchange factor GrpE [Deltaproteobacteria bacterium]
MVEEEREQAREQAAQRPQERKEKKRRSSKEIIEELEAALQKAQEEAKENYEHLLRVSADFENYKKRVAREKAELIRYGNGELIKELLPVIDNLERALEHASGQGEKEGIMEGVEMTLVQFLQTLQRFGVTPISAVGERFDPTRHEAVMELATGDCNPGHVVSEPQKGYLLNDRLLRPAKVVVAKPQGDAGKGKEEA